MIPAPTKQTFFRASSVLIGLGLALRLVYGVGAQAAPISPPAPAWTSPSAMTLQKVGDIPTDGVEHSAYVDNLDCQTLTRPLAGSGVMQSGCFMNTAFGALDVEHEMLSFNGSDDKVIPLLPYSPHEVIWPWPGTVDALALDAAVTDGVYLDLYTNILGNVSDQLDLLGNVIAKQITAPPNKVLTDSTGNRLIVNANSLTFSYGGSWLVVETMMGSFVRINLATLDVTAFAPSIVGEGGSPGLNQSQLAVSDDGRYVAIANVATNSFRVYDLSTCQAQTTQAFMACSSYNYWPFISGQITAIDSLRHLRFLDDGLLSLIARSGNNKTSYELAPTTGISALTDYLAVGDSFASGEGAYTYLAGTDTADNVCHISANSYPLLLSHSLFNAGSGHSVACSGATTTDVLPPNPAAYPGQVKGGVAPSQRTAAAIAQLLNDFSPGYLAQSDFVSHYRPRVVTASIGGNDVGFGDILQECVAPHINVHLTAANSCYATYEDRLELAQRIDREVPKLTSLFKQLRAKSPNSALYVVGYPQIAVDTGNCALNVHLNISEIALSIEIIQHLNAAISQAAQAAGANYVDISQALAGHRLCETTSGQVAVNGLTAGNASGITITSEVGNKSLAIKFLSKESYHPNVLGHQLIEQAILQKTHSFTLASTPLATYQPAAIDSLGLLKAPKSGRATKLTASDNTIVSSPIAAKGSPLQISVSSEKHSLKPSSSYRVTIGTDASSSGSLTTTVSGELTGTITVPAAAQSGAQIITISGVNQLNQPISITTIIYLIDSPEDYDGDGVPNSSDSCPTVINSGVDADQDSIDDACDGEIGTPSNGMTSSGTTGGASSNSSAPTPPAAGTDSNGSATPPALEVEQVIPVTLTSSSNSSADQLASLDSVESADQETSAVPGLSVGSLAISTDRAVTISSGTTEQANGAAASSNGIKAVLGLQTINPNRLGRTAKLQTASHTAGQARRFGGIRVIDWLPWARLFGISLFLLLLINTLLGQQLKRIRLAN